MVIDGGCDPKLTLDDLGNAVRKCRIDFGAAIEFDAGLTELAARKRRWAVASIDYASGGKGHLIYLKPMIFDPELRDEPPDVRSYHDQHADFPHESTADQFFPESQFESYRRLGLHTVAAFPSLAPPDCTDMFSRLAEDGKLARLPARTA